MKNKIKPSTWLWIFVLISTIIYNIKDIVGIHEVMITLKIIGTILLLFYILFNIVYLIVYFKKNVIDIDDTNIFDYIFIIYWLIVTIVRFNEWFNSKFETKNK